MNNRLVAMLVVAFVVGGCSRGEQEGAATDAPAARAPAAPGADVVAAVLQSTGTPVARLSFVIAAKPVLGVRSGLRLDFSAAAQASALLLQVAAEGLTIDPATAEASLTLVDGEVVSHELGFTPQREGLSEITVRLRSGEEGGAEAVYVIPVLVEKPAAGG